MNSVGQRSRSATIEYIREILPERVNSNARVERPTVWEIVSQEQACIEKPSTEDAIGVILGRYG
ncbi:MAG: hypothetical protein J7641_04840 [Cyanobacteria bacterium SID2]|nr:hypothetical protein [Cyanobacteria bacterium SID2]